MANVDKMVDEYKKKKYDEKLKISMNIITNLKDRGNTQAEEIYNKIQSLDRIPERVLEAIYRDFCDSVERVKQEKVEGEMHQFNKSKTYIEKLREQERQERAEEDCEALLDGL